MRRTAPASPWASSRSSAAKAPAVLGREEAVLPQHLDVGDRGAGVVADEAGVEPMVLARGVAEDPLVERLAAVPEAAQEETAPPASLAPTTASRGADPRAASA